MNFLSKLDTLFNTIPDNVKTIIINKYSVGKPKSKRVDQLLTILNKLNDEEKKEFRIYAQEIMEKIGNGLFSMGKGKGMGKTIVVEGDIAEEEMETPEEEMAE